MGRWKGYALSLIWAPVLVAEFALVLFVSAVNKSTFPSLVVVGWGLWALSVIFGVWPILEFRRKGGVRKGQSYIQTTRLVDTGLYGILRHPQYFAGILLSWACACFSQYWPILAMTAVVTVALYADIVNADRYELAKFGDLYAHYMRRVPRVNFLLGIARVVRARPAARRRN